MVGIYCYDSWNVNLHTYNVAILSMPVRNPSSIFDTGHDMNDMNFLHISY